MDSKLIVLGTVVSLIAGILLAVLLEYLQVSGLFQYLQALGETSAIGETLEETGEPASIG
jgi:hypothetical protein